MSPRRTRTKLPKNNLPTATIGDIRRRLQAMGLDATAAEITGVRKIRPAGQVREALALASSDASARTYLTNALADVRHANAELFPPSAPKNNATSQVPQVASLDSRPLVAPASLDPRFPSSRLVPALTTTAVRHGSKSPFVPVLVAKTPGGTSSVAGDAATPGAAEGACYVHGATAALKWSAGTNRKGYATVVLDVAPATKARSYDWNNKITAVLEPDELLMALAVFLGDSPGVTMYHDAESNDDYTHISHSGRHAVVTIRQGGTVRIARIDPPDAYNVAALLVAQIRANTPSGAQADVVTLARETVGRMVKQSACRDVTYLRPISVPPESR
jgi:hypothetical protein